MLDRKILFSPIDKNKKDTSDGIHTSTRAVKKVLQQMNYLLLNDWNRFKMVLFPFTSCIKALAFLQLNHIRCHINGPL